MSVQVRRRREAASFLSTYVGAQGELLVDTTSNRVQVHDGATPGGWPAAGIGDLAGRNAIANGNFAINQRGYASAASLAAGAYAHDRWKAGSGGCTYTFTQAVPDTSVAITAGTLVQAVDGPNVYAATLWLTWTGTATARVWQGSASGAFSPGVTATVGGVAVNALLVTGLTVGAIASVEFSTGTLGLVQLEVALSNAGPTRYERRHGEMVLCQRYYQRINYPLNTTVYDNYSGGNQNLTFPLPFQAMRAAPTTNLVGVPFGGATGAPMVVASATYAFLLVQAVNASRVFANSSPSAAYVEMNAEI